MSSHSYRYAGQYEVRLVVIDEDGLSASTTVTVSVMASKPKTSDLNPNGNGAASDHLIGTPVLSLLDSIGIALVAAGAFCAMTILWWTKKGRKGLT